jgi:hypothetical protein
MAQLFGQETLTVYRKSMTNQRGRLGEPKPTHKDVWASVVFGVHPLPARLARTSLRLKATAWHALALQQDPPHSLDVAYWRASVPASRVRVQNNGCNLWGSRSYARIRLNHGRLTACLPADIVISSDYTNVYYT